MPQVAAGHDVTIERKNAVRTLTLSQVDGPSAFMVVDANIPNVPPILQGPTAKGSRPVEIPMYMSVRIENLGKYPIDYTIA